MLSLIYKIRCIDALHQEVSAALKLHIVRVGENENSAEHSEPQRASQGYAANVRATDSLYKAQ